MVSFGEQVVCIEKWPGSLCPGAWFLLPPRVTNSLLGSRSSGCIGYMSPGVGRGHGVTPRVVNRSTYACMHVCLCLSNIFAISGLFWGEKIPCGDLLLHQTLPHHNKQLRLSVSEIKKKKRNKFVQLVIYRDMALLPKQNMWVYKSGLFL